jgi:DNA-binding MarR family transcriptional regulator
MKNKSNFSVKNADHSSGFLLWQITTLWQREIKASLEAFNLSHSGFVILASLLWFTEQTIEVTQTMIIEHTKLDKMTVSKSLKTLQKNGFIDRFENEIDTRAKTIILTHIGKELAINTLKCVESVDIKFFSKLSYDEKNQLNSLFVKLR